MYGLPEEIIVRIFEELDLRDLLKCSLTCRLFRVTIQSALILQYYVELAVAGVDDSGSASRLTIAERLAELKCLEESWTNLHFRDRRRAPIPLNDVWELLGGVFAHGITSEGGTRGLAFVELPSLVRGTPGRKWQHRDLGFQIRDFSIDPAQDLAVLMDHRVNVFNQTTNVHLLTMSTGEHHPQATSPVLTCIPDQIRRCVFIIQVTGQFLGVFFHAMDHRDKDQLYIWNWKTGRLVTNLTLSSPTQPRIDSFSFLSPRHFVITRFKRQPTVADTPALEVYDFLDSLSTNPRLVRSFQFPSTTASGFTMSMLTRSDASPRGSQWPLSVDSRPFHTAPTSQIMTISVEVVRQTNEICTFMVFVHHSALLEGLEAGRYPADSEVTVPWRDWGPEKSRMLPTLYNEPVWVCYVHGTRYVRREPMGAQYLDRRSYLRMLDFNPLALKRAHDLNDGGLSKSSASSPITGAAANSTCEIVLASQPTIIPARDIFTEDVVTTLPYRDIRSGEAFRYAAVMIDEECLVGLEGGVNSVQGMEFLCF